jgi:hypothetical protein
MDTVDTGMREDRSPKLEVVQREPDGVVLMRHWTDNGSTRHHRTRREWEELAKPVYLKDLIIMLSVKEYENMITKKPSTLCSEPTHL